MAVVKDLVEAISVLQRDHVLGLRYFAQALAGMSRRMNTQDVNVP